jgi:hypothetical protein
MKLSYLINRINYKLGQYVFTEMYNQEDIIDEVNNALVDLHSYGIFRDFTIDKINNVEENVAKSNTYNTTNYIWDVVSLDSIENGEKIPCQLSKYGKFSNWNNSGLQAREYVYS